MASIKTLEAIDRYKRAYYEYHGHLPDIIENHGWIRIGGILSTSYRPKEIIKMADNLIKRIREGKRHQQKNEGFVWVVDDDEIIKSKAQEINGNWKEFIKKDLFELFMDRLFKECDENIYDMERIMKDYALGGSTFFKNEEELQELNRIIDRLKKEILSNKLISLENAKLNDMNRKLKIINDNLNTDIKNIKNNSVIFTMDDI